MESYKHLLSSEGCSSSESGWTSYIASPMEEDEPQCSYDDVEYNCNSFTTRTSFQEIDKDDNGSDDSMASDASSGPSHHQHRLVLPSRSKESDSGSYKRDMKQSRSKKKGKQEKKGAKRVLNGSDKSLQDHEKAAQIQVLLIENTADYS